MPTAIWRRRIARRFQDGTTEPVSKLKAGVNLTRRGVDGTYGAFERGAWRPAGNALNRTKLLDERVAGIAGILRERLAGFAKDRLIQHFEEARVAIATVALRTAGVGLQPADFPQGYSRYLGPRNHLKTLCLANQEPSDPGRAAGWGSRGSLTWHIEDATLGDLVSHH